VCGSNIIIPERQRTAVFAGNIRAAPQHADAGSPRGCLSHQHRKLARGAAKRRPFAQVCAAARIVFPLARKDD
jgi:hypothetical protein